MDPQEEEHEKTNGMTHPSDLGHNCTPFPIPDVLQNQSAKKNMSPDARIRNTFREFLAKKSPDAHEDTKGEEEDRKELAEALGREITNLTIKDVAELNDSYIVVNPSGDVLMIHQFCMVIKGTPLWSFLDHVTKNARLLNSLLEASNETIPMDEDETTIVPISILPIRKMKDGRRASFGVPLDLVQGSVQYLTQIFYASCSRIAKEGGENGIIAEAYLNEERKRNEKLSFKNFDEKLFAKYLRYAKLPEESYENLLLLFRENPDHTKKIFEVLTKSTFGNQIIDSPIETRGLQKADSPNPEDTKMEEEPANESDKMVNQEDSYFMNLLFERLKEFRIESREEMSTITPFNQAIDYTIDASRKRAQLLSTPDGKGTLHENFENRKEILRIILSEAIMQSLTIFNSGPKTKTEDGSDPTPTIMEVLLNLLAQLLNL